MVLGVDYEQHCYSVQIHLELGENTFNVESEDFLTGERVRQSGVLSPLYNIALDYVTREVNIQNENLLVGYRNLKSEYTTECVFADDLH